MRSLTRNRCLPGEQGGHQNEHEYNTKWGVVVLPNIQEHCSSALLAFESQASHWSIPPGAQLPRFDLVTTQSAWRLGTNT